MSDLRRLSSLRNYSQPLQAGLTSAAPTALKKREVKGSDRPKRRARYIVKAGRCGSVRSMLRPYGIFLRQYASEITRRENQKSRRDAGATKGGPGLSIRAGIAVAGTTCCAPAESWYGRARPGVESGSLPAGIRTPEKRDGAQFRDRGRGNHKSRRGC
jgi:hypothetical protein